MATDRILDKWSGRVIGELEPAGPARLAAAIAAATGAFRELRAAPRHLRHDLLERVSRRLADERRDFAELIVREAGKPLTQALGEVDRAVLTFSLAADEARRFGGEVVPLDLDPRTTAHTGLVHRFPIGPISAISPFNFPLNLLAHKVAPALAVGSAVVVKPPPQCPTAAFRLAELVVACGAPAGAVEVVHMHAPLAERMATDPGFALLSFTGSTEVGWHLKAIAGKKKVLLELGGNAAALVHEDCAVEDAAGRLAIAAFAYAGQVCIKVQRILVHRPIWTRFVDAFVAATRGLVVGDPMDAATVVGPVIDAKAADRIEAWIGEALGGGARALVRGERAGNLLGPTVLTDVGRDQKVCREEVFGPVVTLAPYDRFEDGLALANDGRFGLQAGVFTADLGRAFEAFRTLEVGGVVVGDVPTLRVDSYPYGGVKDSGFGREGVRYAMDEMSEPRMLVLNLARSILR
jgi:glyceraldehyde-3-phosphate dehydrogenase (NADP+)